MRWNAPDRAARVDAQHASPRPDDGRRMFISVLIVVVLPAPFGPTNAKTLPAGTAIVRSRTASVRP